jgi:hypothetical protein
VACGITIGTPVRVRGVRVGNVLSVRPSLECVDVLVEVRPALSCPLIVHTRFGRVPPVCQYATLTALGCIAPFHVARTVDTGGGVAGGRLGNSDPAQRGDRS